jgi:hypothetical protein
MNDPTEPTDNADPTDPMDRTDPFEPIDSTEPSDHRDNTDLEHSGPDIGPLVPIQPRPGPVRGRRRCAGDGRPPSVLVPGRHDSRPGPGRGADGAIAGRARAALSPRPDVTCPGHRPVH